MKQSVEDKLRSADIQSDVWFLEGMVTMQRGGDINDAMKCFEKSIEIDPSNLNAKNALVKLQQRKK